MSDSQVNEDRVVELLAQSLRLDEASVWLQVSSKLVWRELRLELAGTSKAFRRDLWEKRIKKLVEAKYKALPDALDMYYRPGTYAKSGKARHGQARWSLNVTRVKSRFVNLYRQHDYQRKRREASQKPEHGTAPDYRKVEISIKTSMGGWDEDGLLAGLSNLLSRVPADVLDPILQRARARVRKAVA